MKNWLAVILAMSALFSLGVAAVGCAALGVATEARQMAVPPPEDGYRLFVQACGAMDAVVKRYGAGYNSDMVCYARDGWLPDCSSDQAHDGQRKPSVKLLGCLSASGEALALLRRAADTPRWSYGPVMDLCSGGDGSFVKRLALVRAAAGHAVRQLQTGGPVEAFNELSMTNRAIQRLSRRSFMEFMLYQAMRGCQLNALASAVDAMPEWRVAACLETMKRQYRNCPRLSDALRGEVIFLRECFLMKVDEVVGQPTFKRALMEARIRLAALKPATPEEARMQAEGKLFSPAEWAEGGIVHTDAAYGRLAARADGFVGDAEGCRKFCGELAAEIRARNPRAAAGVEDAVGSMQSGMALMMYSTLTKDKAGTLHGTTAMLSAARDGGVTGILAKAADAGTIAELKRISDDAGEVWCQWSATFMDTFPRFVSDYGSSIGRERLLLVRLAVRVYRAQTGAWPKTWQALVDAKLLAPEMIQDPATGRALEMQWGATGRPDAYFFERRGDEAIPVEVRLEPLRNMSAATEAGKR